MDDEPGRARRRRATRVGLGRVVENPVRARPRRAGARQIDDRAGDAPGVDEASDASFPASDPPGFDVRSPPTPAVRERSGLSVSGRPSA